MPGNELSPPFSISLCLCARACVLFLLLLLLTVMSNVSGVGFKVEDYDRTCLGGSTQTCPIAGALVLSNG